MGRRPARLGEAIREEVSQMVAYELKDPRLGLVTVTRVEVSPDLGHARVHVGIVGSPVERKKSLEALRNAAGFVRRELSQRLGIRQVPEVDFRFDKGLEASERVARLLDEDKAAVAAALAASQPAAAPEAADATDAGTQEPADPSQKLRGRPDETEP
jgi:ribosome-binding factor A